MDLLMSLQGALGNEGFSTFAADVRLLACVDHRVVLHVLRSQESCKFKSQILVKTVLCFVCQISSEFLMQSLFFSLSGRNNRNLQ